MTDDFVNNGAWATPAGRPDAIDDVADQFERPVTGGEAFWSTAGAWPRSSRGWRSFDRLHPRTLERHAG